MFYFKNQKKHNNFKNSKQKDSRQKNSKQRGAAFVEFALVLPIILFAFFGIFAVSRLFITYSAMENLARAGTLWGSARLPYCNSSGDCTYPACKVGTVETNWESTKNIDPKKSCINFAIMKMNESAESYIRILQLKDIDYTIQVSQESVGSSTACLITITASAKYKDNFFGNKDEQSSLNFGMDAEFKPFNPKISFKSISYRSELCG
ncbi:MAG: TadE/TadG family type IV pilus assembly protein [Bdellovibrionota bacterium]